MEELTEAVVEEIVKGVEEARAGQVSLYGLFGLLEALEPIPVELDIARRKRDEGGQLSGVLRAVASAESVLANAPAEMKRTLAEDMDRAVQVEGITARERARALAFIEAQLKAAAKDNSEKGAVRRSKLKEKRSQLETCPTVGESKEVLKAEKNLQAQQKEFSGAREAYEMWQAGRVKFSSNTELQATKRRYETLKKQVSSAQAELEAALRRRRPPGAATSEPGTWKAGAGVGGPSVPVAKAATNGKASAPKAKAVRAFAPAPRGQPARDAESSSSEDEPAAGGGQHWPSLAGGPKAPHAAPPPASKAAPSKPKAKAPPVFAEPPGQEDGGTWQRRVRAAPDTSEADKKREAQREAKNAAKRRGQELMAELGAQLRGGEPEPVPAPAARNAGAVARGGGAAQAARQGWSAVPGQVRAELEASRPRSSAPPPSQSVHFGAAAAEEAEEEEEEEEEGEAAEGEEGGLADGWEAVWSEEHGSYYYWNTSSDDVQWEPPLRQRQPARPPPPPVPGDEFSAEAPQPASSSGSAPAAAGQGKKKKKGKSSEVAAEEVYRPSAAELQEASRRQTTAEAIARARRNARGEEDYDGGVRGASWSPEAEEEGPRLSFECVCSAVAAELGLTPAQVRELGVSSVTEWRANFPAEEWGRVRSRAAALESAKKAMQQKAEKDRSARHLARIAESHGAAPTTQRQATTPKAAGAGRGAAAGGAGGRGRGAAGLIAGPGPPQQQAKKAAKKQPAKPPPAGLDAMAHRNRFANFGGDDSSSSED